MIDLGKSVSLQEREDNILESARKEFDNAKHNRDGAVKKLAQQYFKELVEDMNGEPYARLMATDPLFKYLDSQLPRHNTFDSKLNDEDEAHWQIRHFSNCVCDLLVPTLYERFPAIKKQLADLVPASKRRSLLIQYEGGSRRYGINKLISLIQDDSLNVFTDADGFIRDELTKLLVQDVSFKDNNRDIEIVDSKTKEILCPNKEFIQSISLLKNWYETAKEVIGNPQGIMVKENAKRVYGKNYTVGEMLKCTW